MPRTARRESASDLYHVTARGAGRRRIFDDDADRKRFVSGLCELTTKDDIGLLAWCLMDNHIHLLAKTQVRSLSKGMHRLTTSYAHYFNGRHGHVGPVFQDRFDSLPIETDEHLLAAVRYIHLNPMDLGIARPENYPWSSFREYLGKPRLCAVETVLDLAGGKESFADFCNPSNGRDHMATLDERHPRISEAEAARIVQSCFGPDFADRFALFDNKERNRALRRLKMLGLSIRQIERLTGIGRNIIARA